MQPLSQRNSPMERFLTANNKAASVLVLLIVLLISACQKKMDAINNQSPLSQKRIEVTEIKEWVNTMLPTLVDQPTLLFSRAEQSTINGNHFVRIPTLGKGSDGGSFYFKRRPDGSMKVNYVVRLVSDSIKGNGLVGFANLDEKTFRVNVYENNKLVQSKIVPDSLGLFNQAFLSSATQIKKFDEGCELEDVTRITLPDGSDSVIIVKSLGDPKGPKTGCIGAGGQKESFWQKLLSTIENIGSSIGTFFGGGGLGGNGGGGNYGGGIGGNNSWNPGSVDYWSYWLAFFNGGNWGQFPIPPGMFGVTTFPGIDALYPELNSQILDENVRIKYKQNYLALVELYNQRIADGLIVDLYAGMSSKEFIDLLKNNQLLALNIDPITILVKVGASGAADVLVQMFFARLLDDNVSDWNEALSKVNWTQVWITMITGVLPISNKYIMAAINASSVVYEEVKLNGFSSWDKLGRSFVEGFMGSIIGSSLGDLIADKFANIGNLGRKLVTKFEGIFSYGTICRWLGGGISNVSESLLTSKGIITSTRKIIGWGGSNKVAVIGRYMEDRVIPYANKMGAAFFDVNNPLAAPYFTQEVLTEIAQFNRAYGFNWPKNVVLSSKLFKANQQFIIDLKKLGYTFIDLGGPSGSDFYDMEIKEIFD